MIGSFLRLLVSAASDLLVDVMMTGWKQCSVILTCCERNVADVQRSAHMSTVSQRQVTVANDVESIPN